MKLSAGTTCGKGRNEQPGSGWETVRVLPNASKRNWGSFGFQHGKEARSGRQRQLSAVNGTSQKVFCDGVGARTERTQFLMGGFGWVVCGPMNVSRKLFSKEDDAVGVGAFGVVLDAPAVGGLGELLVVDEDEFGLKSGCDAAGKDGFFEFDFAAADFADFEGDVTAGFENTMEFVEDTGHNGLPILKLARGGELDGFGIDAEEPAAEPVVAGVVDDVEERGRGDDEGDGVAGDVRCGVGRAGEETGLGADLGEGVAELGGAFAEELLGFLENDFGNLASRRSLVAVGVDFLLGLERDGLVGRQGVNGKETRGMAGKAVEGDHANPVVDGIEGVLLALGEEIFFERAEFLQGFGMIKNEEVFGKFGGVLQVDLGEARGDLVKCGWIEAWADEDTAEGIGVRAEGDTTGEGGFKRSGAAAHEGVMDDVAGVGKSIDKEARELGFEAGAIGDFVQAVGGALLGGPEFVDVGGDLKFGNAVLERGLEESRTLTKFAEISELGLKRGLPKLSGGFGGQKGQFVGFARHGYGL